MEVDVLKLTMLGEALGKEEVNCVLSYMSVLLSNFERLERDEGSSPPEQLLLYLSKASKLKVLLYIGESVYFFT